MNGQHVETWSRCDATAEDHAEISFLWGKNKNLMLQFAKDHGNWRIEAWRNVA